MMPCRKGLLNNVSRGMFQNKPHHGRFLKRLLLDVERL